MHIPTSDTSLLAHTAAPRTRLGALFWIVGTVQFFLCHSIVAWAWAAPYSWAHNNISDLGNVACGTWGDNGRYVCSPLHTLMNISFVLQGLLLGAGLVLAYRLWRRSMTMKTAYTLLFLAALGWIIVGLAPADLHENIHVVLGAAPIFLCGNGGLLLIGKAAQRRRGMRVLGGAAVVLGAIGLVATGLFMRQQYLGLGIGGMERLAAFPVQVWTCALGVSVLCRDDKAAQRLSEH